MHLWRITAHNAVHRCEVAEMLKAPPHHFRAGAVTPAASDKPAELGDPGDRLAQRRRPLRVAWGPDGWHNTTPAIQSGSNRTLHGASGTARCQHGGVKNPPRQGHYRAPRHGVSARLLELPRFEVAPAFQNPVPDFNAPTARVTIGRVR